MSAITDQMVEAGVEEIRKAKHTCFDRWTDNDAIRAVLEASVADTIAVLSAKNEGLRKALDEIDAAASAAYCASLRQFEKDECLGWVRKVEAGKFGEAEHKAHQQANMLMGKSQGLWEALKIARAALEAKP